MQSNCTGKLLICNITFVGQGRFARSMWTGCLREMGVLLLKIDAEDLLHDEQVKLVGVAASFVLQGVESGGGEGAFAGEKEAAIIGGEEVVELGLGEA